MQGLQDSCFSVCTLFLSTEKASDEDSTAVDPSIDHAFDDTSYGILGKLTTSIRGWAQFRAQSSISKKKGSSAEPDNPSYSLRKTGAEGRN